MGIWRWREVSVNGNVGGGGERGKGGAEESCGVHRRVWVWGLDEGMSYLDVNLNRVWNQI